MRTRMIAIVLLCGFTTGCASRSVRLPGTAAVLINSRDFIDLQPGWRLRIVTPMLRSGGYKLNTLRDLRVPDDKSVITVPAGNDFLGYELAYFSVEPRGNRLTLSLASASTFRGGKQSAESTSIAPLPKLPGYTRYIRLIYLTRVSDADHDMAMLAAKQQDDLASLTARVLRNPVACRVERGRFCSWIPAGVAVTPESRSGTGETARWVSAR